MSENRPRHIICAVRGGPESRDTVTGAIDRALESGGRLTFLHVVDAEFLDKATIGPISVVYQELVEMSNFMMIILLDRAKRRGVANVDYVVREGNVRKQLLQFALETQADTLILGEPVRSQGRYFKPAGLEALAVEMEQTCGLKVVVVQHDSQA